MSDPTRPAWFTGREEALAVLRRAARDRGITLDPATAPNADEAWELSEGLCSILIAEGFEGDWEITPFGDMVEDLIDGLHQYAEPD
jgi:hypothetical protein